MESARIYQMISNSAGLMAKSTNAAASTASQLPLKRWGHEDVWKESYTWPGSNWRPSACEADVIATRPQVLLACSRTGPSPFVSDRFGVCETTRAIARNFKMCLILEAVGTEVRKVDASRVVC